MRLLRLVLVAVAFAVEAAAYLRERRRLAEVSRLSGAAGRDYLERTQERSTRFMVALTAVLALGAGTVWIVIATKGPPRTELRPAPDAVPAPGPARVPGPAR